MKVMDVIVLFILFSTLIVSTYFLYLQIPGDKVDYEPYKSQNSLQEPVVAGIQFYPNMRYKDKEISYSIEDTCSDTKKENAIRAFSVISAQTVLKFNQVSSGQIKVLCSTIAPEPRQENHFIAGEGGPTEIINTSRYNVIFGGKVSLFRDERCDMPNIATHEILHALGFDHNDNSKSIMYPITNCDQQIDEYIISDIDRLYKDASSPDLGIESINASQAGRYFSFNIVIANYGIEDASNVVLGVSSGGTLVKDFELDTIPIGTKKFLEVKNMRINRDSRDVGFSVKMEGNGVELDYANNEASITLE